jgi:hypothetical protein
MQKRERHSPTATQQILLRPLQESNKILDLLVEMSLRINRPMSEEWMKQFLKDTNNFPMLAVEHMIQEWGSTGKALPKLSETKQIIEIYIAEHTALELCGHCDTGWVHGFKDAKGKDAVKRCECVSR